MMKLRIRKKRQKVVRSVDKKSSHDIAKSVFCVFEDTNTGFVYHCNMMLMANSRPARWRFLESIRPEVSDRFLVELNREVNGFIEPKVVISFPVNHMSFEMDEDYETRSLIYKFFQDIQSDNYKENKLLGIDPTILFNKADACISQC